MISRLLFIALVLSLVNGPSEAVPSNEKEKHWKSMLPETPIPTLLIQLFRQSPSATKEEIITKNLNVIKSDECPDGKWKYDAPASIIQDPIVLSMAQDEFFLEENLRNGIEMKFPKSDVSHVEFLSRQDADSLPFSTRKLPQILNLFGLSKNSAKAKRLNNTLKTCEAAPMRSEKKICASSLEAMLSFVVSLLGHHAKVYSSHTEDSTTRLKIFAKEVVANDVLVCHKMKYPYAVFMCHSSEETTAYRLQLIGPNSERATQIVVCHHNTSMWSETHISFQVLHVRRGETSVCHTTPTDTLVWGHGLV